MRLRKGSGSRLYVRLALLITAVQDQLLINTNYSWQSRYDPLMSNDSGISSVIRHIVCAWITWSTGVHFLSHVRSASNLAGWLPIFPTVALCSGY